MNTNKVDRKRNQEEAERKCAEVAHPSQSITNDPPAPYGDLVPSSKEDRTLDVCNAREEEYMHRHQLQNHK